MSLHKLSDGVLRQVSDLYKLQDGSLRRVAALYKMEGGSLRLIASFSPTTGASGMTISVDPANAEGFGASRNPQTVVSEVVTATPMGGSAPYSYNWTATNGMSVVNQGMASTRFSAFMFDETRTASFACTCTDALGKQAATSGTITLTQIPRPNNVE